MGDYFTNATSPPVESGIQYLRRTVNWNSPGYSATASTQGSFPLGAIPAGAIVIGVDVNIETAFNAGTTNVLEVGTAADLDGFAVNTAGTVAGTPGFKPSLQGALSGIPAAADTVVNAYYIFTGTAPTTGKGQIIVKFAPKREGTGQAFPAN